MKKKNSLFENFKTLFYAIIAALIIRSFLFEPFSIPSGSMYPTLFVGDYLFVSKFTYGYSRHSFPLSFPIIPERIFYKEPKRGDVIVFKTPEDNKTDYIKRLIGLPGDKVEMISNQLFINNKKVKREKVKDDVYSNFKVEKYKETLNNGKSYDVFEFTERVSFYETNSFSEITVPKDHFFVLGDNRDNSQDSRFVGSIPKSNLVGKAVVVLLSFDTEKGSWWKVWSWFSALRKDRFFYSLLPNEDKE
tara:strand:+ start:218 stop:958 length:741 start_codon:yes stop_codon:yes gene_type:complete